MSEEQTPEALVRMANQIAGNTAYQPHDAAVATVAAHLKAFWAPSMRSRLQAYLDAGGEGVVPVAREALEALRG